MASEVSRRDFLTSLGVTVGATAFAAAVPGVGAMQAEAGEPARGRIPSTPYKIGHMTFFTGPAAVLGEPMYKGLMMAVDEINAEGGLLKKRKIEVLKADEAAGTDANVKELRRMKLSENINLFSGITSSGNTPALGPVAEEVKCLTIFVDGCTDFLFDKAVPNPKYIFRITNQQSADGVTCAVATSKTWPEVRKIAHIHPDYAYGRNAFKHFTVAIQKLIPGTEVVYEGWPKLFSTDFTQHITNAIAAKPDLLVSSIWGGDYVAMYKQGLGYDLFKKMKFASTIAFGVAPHAIGKDHPEGIIAGVHSNYYFTYPPAWNSPINASFVSRYFNKWQEYPNFQAEGSYVAMQLLKGAIERANKKVGGWPEELAIISQLEGASFPGPAGTIHIRKENHQGYKDAVTGFSINSPNYPFQILDPNRMITIPVKNIAAPPGWPKPDKADETSTSTWIEQTWFKAG